MVRLSSLMLAGGLLTLAMTMTLPSVHGLGRPKGLLPPEYNASIGDDYKASIESWRQERVTRLSAEDGWLSVAGLFFLQDGENRVGSDPLNDIVLPEGSAPPEVGVFEFRGGKTTFRAKSGVPILLNGLRLSTASSGQGQLAEAKELRTGAQDSLTLGALTMFVHKSGGESGRFAIRIRDKNSRIRREFSGITYFPIDERYRVSARFVPYSAPKPVKVPNILGDLEDYSSPGTVTITLNGESITMEPVVSGEQLFFIFRDLTSGKETYRAARFLYTDMPKDGQVVLDFNRAQNPPCAFNPYTTCPLPPEQNRLRVRVEAGEMTYQGFRGTRALPDS